MNVADRPALSVIVPVFNGERFLERSLLSLCSQSLNGLEIIVVDDGSCDSSADVVKRLQASHPQLRLVQIPVNRGSHAARLEGVTQAKADWIGFVDSDDWVDPRMYESMLLAGVQASADIVICGVDRIRAKRHRREPKIRFAGDRVVSEDIFARFCSLEFGSGMFCNKIYRREIIGPAIAIQFPWRQDINEDLLVNFECFSIAKVVMVLRDTYYSYVENVRSASLASGSVAAFVQMLRAYAIATQLFASRGQRVLGSISNMYRAQFDWACYTVDDVVQLAGYQEQLLEAAEMIHRNFPLGLAMLSSRPSRNHSLLRRISAAARSMVERVSKG